MSWIYDIHEILFPSLKSFECSINETVHEIFTCLFTFLLYNKYAEEKKEGFVWHRLQQKRQSEEESKVLS